MALTETARCYPFALRWLAEPLPRLDYAAMGANLTSEEREILTRYVRNIEHLAGMQAPRGWNIALGVLMVGRQLVPKPDSTGYTRGAPFEFDPSFDEFLDAFIFRLRKLYLARDPVTFHNARTALGRRAPRDHDDVEAFMTLLGQLKQEAADALAGKAAPVQLHGPDGSRVRAEQFFDAWLHDQELHENLSTSPKRSSVWEAFPDQLTRAAFINTAFSLFAVYGKLGRVVARVLGVPFAAPQLEAPIPRTTPTD